MCFAITNNHNNKYDPNTIYTSTQYLIDNDPELLKDEKKIMDLTKHLLTANSQVGINFRFSINCNIVNLLNKNPILSITDFRKIIDSIIDNNIGNLPSNADEVSVLNGTLTTITLCLLLNNTVIKHPNNTQHDLLLFNDLKDSIFGKKYCSHVNTMDTIKYKNKACKFYIEKKLCRFYYIVKMS